jgi:hypothetical protein
VCEWRGEFNRVVLVVQLGLIFHFILNPDQRRVFQLVLYTGHSYGNLQDTMEIVHITTKGQLMDTIEKYHISNANKKGLQLNGTYINNNNDHIPTTNKLS